MHAVPGPNQPLAGLHHLDAVAVSDGIVDVEMQTIFMREELGRG